MTATEQFLYKPYRMHIDVESFSPTNLKTCGMYRYWDDPDAEVILLSYALDDGPTRIFDLLAGEQPDAAFFEYLEDPDVLKIAFNAGFERQAILKQYGIYCDPVQWRDTMVLGLSLGLPGSLAMQARVLNMPIQKQEGIGKGAIKTFCIPCKATKKNGYRTRNYPVHFPDVWAAFKAYNGNDVDTERALWVRLLKYNQDCLWPAWALDQRINDRGVRVDMELVENAIAMNDLVKAKLVNEAARLTGLSNPNSVQQLIAWLNDAEEEEDKLRDRFADDDDAIETKITNLRKKTVIELLGTVKSPTALRVLELRQLMAKASVSKYRAMQRSVCRDGRIRGLLQYYGAARTGRWAGRILQVQNLPQNHLKDLALCRELVKRGDLPTLELLFGESVLIVLSELIRTALIPSPGMRFISCDFKSVEARLTAWDAQEEWRLEVFRTHGLIYEASASQMFRVPLEQIKKGGKREDLRPKGKVTELACFGPDTQVLTERGYVAIVDVSLDDRLWDGEKWVKHSGLVSRGVKAVLNLDGVSVTEDHPVMVAKNWLSAKTVSSSASALCLALETGSESLPLTALNSALQVECSRSGCAVPAALMRIRSVLETLSKGLRRVAFDAPSFARETRARSSSSTPMLSLTTSIDGDCSIGLRRLSVDATSQQTRAIQTTVAGVSTFATSGAMTNAHSCDTSSPAPDGMTHGWRWTAPKLIEAMNRAISGLLRSATTIETNGRSKSFRPELMNLRDVYDIALAGPLNRFTIRTNSGHLIVHNCGFQGSVNALINMGALEGKDAMKLDELLPAVKLWRLTSPNVVNGWYRTQDNAEESMKYKRVVKEPRYGFEFFGGTLFQILPTGRKLAYPHARIEHDEKFGKDGIVFDGVNQYTHTWGTVRTFGGKLFQNRIQADGADLMIYALTNIEREIPDIVFSVHDEGVMEVPIDWKAGPSQKDPKKSEGAIYVESLMCIPHKAFPGLPLAADADDLMFYKK